jgi:hypothetical protein
LKKITPPIGHDDFAKLRDLKDYKKTNISAVLENWIPKLETQYKAYDTNVANPFTVTTLIDSDNFATLLKNAYTSPPLPLKDFIENLRNKGSPDVCPMCGSLKTGTLDHYFPKDNYPEYSFFLKNLVPACDCNSKRGVNLLGHAPLEKILHPYYDDCLKERLVTSMFVGDMNKPYIDIQALPSLSANITTVKFHIDNILRRMPIIPWLEHEWVKTLRMPREILPNIPLGVVTAQDVLTACLTRLQSVDREYGTPNNWKSIFFHGLTQHKMAVEKITEAVNENKPFAI